MSDTLTADQLTTGIANAIRARNLEAVVDLLYALVFVDPRRAEAVYDTLQAGIVIGRGPAIPEAGLLETLLRERASHD